ncbi:MAG: methylated-DNA--[protein]-cysteine S-methyltransferase [Solirubrobacterales bacterium]
MALQFALFPTAIGRCGVAWDEVGIRRVQLPARTDRETTSLLAAGTAVSGPRRPPRWVADTLDQVTRHLHGEPQRFAGARLDLSGVPQFHREVYLAASDIPPGKTASYGEVAERLGRPGAARAVGQALARNPLPVLIPCHRVLAANGAAGGFSAPGGLTTKARLLELEGVRLGPGRLPEGGQLSTREAGTAIAALTKADPRLGRLMARVGSYGLTVQSAHQPFQALAEAIVHQQLNGRAAASIMARIRALFPARGLVPARVLAIDDSALRGAGLSAAKVAAFKDLARRTLDGTVPTLARLKRLSDDEIVERLTSVRGIGRWTVEMLLIFDLGRRDVLPVDDFGIRKGFSLAFGLPDLPKPAQVAERGERWRPHRTVASWYLWRAIEWYRPKPA